ncbi:MAG: hypothetical protein M3Q74_00035 [Pseudomonadota bacterium]|nr:hypothetical protein [Pseudomonadota bacterium]
MAQTSYTGVGVALGTAIGVALGIAMDNLALGIGGGIAIGLALGVGMDSRGKPRGRDSSGSDSSTYASGGGGD